MTFADEIKAKRAKLMEHPDTALALSGKLKGKDRD